MNSVTPDNLPPSWQVHVVCRSAETATAWQHRAEMLPRLDIRPVVGALSYYRVIDETIASGATHPVIVCHDDIRCGFDFADAIDSLVREIGERFSKWGVCGNAGIDCTGRQVSRYVLDPHGGPEQGATIDPVWAIDGNLLLLNVPELAEAGVQMPVLEGFHGYDVALSLECWVRGLPVLCDRRLFVMHKSAGDQGGFDRFCKGKEFRDYLTARLVNHYIPTLNGLIDLTGSQDYRYLDIAQNKDGRHDLFDVFDHTLSRCRKRIPTLTIACRTQLDRLELLDRAMMTFFLAASEAPELVRIEILLTSDKPIEELAFAAERIRQRLPAIPLQICPVGDLRGRYSRVAALIAAVEQCQSDFIWFVDDDDFVFPASIRPISRTLASGVPRLIAGHAQRIEERWSQPGCGLRILLESLAIGRLPAEGVFHAFSGDNHTPICSVIFPVGVLKTRLCTVAARGDYYEDYFFLLLTLSAPRIEVRCVDADFCGISLRGGENTVNQLDREHWDLSYATFMNEILRPDCGASPLLWQLAQRSNGQSAPPEMAGSPTRWRRLAPGLWPLLVRRALLHLRQEGWRAALGRIGRYVAK